MSDIIKFPNTPNNSQIPPKQVIISLSKPRSFEAYNNQLIDHDYARTIMIKNDLDAAQLFNSTSNQRSIDYLNRDNDEVLRKIGL